MVTKEISCDDLYENGYRWSPGVDVTLLGRKYQDTIIYYQVSKKTVINTPNTPDYPAFSEDMFGYDLEEENVIESKLVEEVYKYQEYIDKDPLFLSDSIYELVWGDLKEQQKKICKDFEINYRYFKLKIEESRIDSFTDNLVTTKYKVIYNKQEDESYKIKEFEVINFAEKDTFNCYFYRADKEFYLSSIKKIK